jgi:uncharacterized protein (TIGR00251 family)
MAEKKGPADGVGETEGCIRPRGELILLEVKAVPGASKTEAAGIEEGRLRVRIAAAAEGGKANRELRAFLAKRLGCAKGEVLILRGEKSRLKTLSLPASVREGLERLAASPPGKAEARGRV